MRLRETWIGLACLFVGFLGISCASAPPPRTTAMEDAGIGHTRRELESLMYDYGHTYAGRVDVAASEIYEDTTDPLIRRRVVEWNTLCASQMLLVAFNHEPLMGLVHAWGLAALVREFYDTGTGKDYFGPYQDRVVHVSRDLENDIHQLARSVLPAALVDTLAFHVDRRVEQYPITNDRFITGGLGPKMLQAMGAELASGVGAVGAINEQIVAMANRANILAAYAPRQLQWQTAAALSQTKAMLSDVRDSTLEVIHHEAMDHLDPILEFLASQRALMTRDLVREREAVLTALAAERSAVLTEIAMERNEVFNGISKERIAAVKDINALALATLENAIAQSRVVTEAAIDRFFLRTLQLMVVPLVVLTVLVIIVMIWTRNTIHRVLEIQENRHRFTS
jgi:hypothetical protein